MGNIGLAGFVSYLGYVVRILGVVEICVFVLRVLLGGRDRGVRL